MHDDDGHRWILQEFATVAGQPWFALQWQNDAGVERQYTGYRHEVTALAARIGVVPEELERTTEEAFFRRFEQECGPADRLSNS